MLINDRIANKIIKIYSIRVTDVMFEVEYLQPVADLGGDASPPTSLKVTILAEKSASVSNNSAPFRDASPPPT